MFIEIDFEMNRTRQVYMNCRLLAFKIISEYTRTCLSTVKQLIQLKRRFKLVSNISLFFQ